MSVVRKYEKGSQITQNKIKFNINNKDIDFDEEDIDKIYGAAISSLPEDEQEYARQYVAQELKPSILIGKNKADTMGSGMLNFNIEGSGRLAESNRQYSNADLKKMFKTKEEREAFLKRNKSISSFNKNFESNLANYINQKDLSESQKMEQDRLKEKNLLKNRLSESSDFFKYNYGPNQVSSDIGHSQAQYNFSKLSPEERQAKINNWLSGYAGNISQLNLENENDIEYAQSIFGSKYNDVVSQVKGKFTDGKLNINPEDYPALANLLQVNLQMDILNNPDMINKWSSLDFSGTKPTEGGDSTTPEIIRDSQGAYYQGDKPYTGLYEDMEIENGLPLTGYKNDLYYKEGKPYTGYMAPQFNDESKSQDIVKIFNPQNYGGYVGGKRMGDKEFYDYVSRLPAAEKAKYEDYYNNLQTRYNTLPSQYVDLSKITDSNKTIVDYLRRNKLGNYALDITKYYDITPGGRMIQVANTELSKNNAEPWTTTLKNYRVYSDQSGKLYHEPFTIETDPKTGDEIAVFIRNGKRYVSNLGKSGSPKETTTTHDFATPFYGKPVLKKKGGLLPKLQLGGGFMKSMSYDPEASSDLQKKISSTSQQKLKTSQMNPFSSKPEGIQLTAADYADLTALGLDVASMIAQIAPGYGNIVSSAGGLGSTIATAVGDVSRDGLDWGDAGNLGMNLLMDGASLIPGVGVGAKGAKILKSVKRLEPILKIGSIALMGYGMTGAANAMKKAISNPDQMTVDDWKNMATGFRALIGGAKGYTNQIGKTKTKESFFNVKNQDGSLQKVQLKPEQLEKLNSIKSGDKKTEYLQTVANENLKGASAQATVDAGKKVAGLKMGWNPIKMESNPKIQTESSYRFKTEQELEGTNPLTKYFANRNRVAFEKYANKGQKKPQVVDEANESTNASGQPFKGVPPTPPPNGFAGNNQLAGQQASTSTTKQNNSQRIEGSVNSLQNKRKSTGSRTQRIILSDIENKIKIPNRPSLSPLRDKVIQANPTVTEQTNPKSFSAEKFLYLQNQLNKSEKVKKTKPLFLKRNENINPRQSKSKFNSQTKKTTRVNKGRVVKAANGLLLKPAANKPLVFSGYKANIGHLQGDYSGKMVKFDKPSFEKPVLFNQQSVNLNKQPITVSGDKASSKRSLFSKINPIMAGDLARTLAGNIANSQMNTTVSTPLFQQSSEQYLSPAGTGIRDSHYRAASRFEQRTPQTTDATTNELIRRSNFAKAEDLRMQGEMAMSQQSEEIKHKNQVLAGEYANQRSAIANQNIENMSQSENQRIQLENMRRGLNAENIQNFATRWLMDADKKIQENKKINQQIALNNISRQVSPETQKLQQESNQIRDLARSQNRSLSPAEQAKLIDLENRYAKYNNLITDIQLQSMKNPNYRFDLSKEKQKYQIFKSGGQLSAIDRYNMNNDNRLNRMMEKKYDTSLKYRMEFLKELLKNKKK